MLRRDYEQLSWPLFDQLTAKAGDAADDFVELWCAPIVVMDSGALRSGHMRAFVYAHNQLVLNTSAIIFLAGLIRSGQVQYSPRI